MDNFDKKIREKAKKENRQIPENVKSNIENTLNSLEPKKAKVYRMNLGAKIITVAASFIFVFLFVLPNVSVSYANSIEKIPVIGSITKVITIRNYIYNDENHELDIKVPEVSGNGESPNYINSSVDELTSVLVSEFYKDLELNGSNGHGSIKLDYEPITNTDLWFTLKLSITETMADSYTYFKFYHIDKQNDKIVILKDLFIDDSFKALIENEIKRQMIERTKENVTDVYWSEDTEIGESLTNIEDTRNFYINGDNKLVISFDKYEVSPGSMGTPEFTIPTEIIKDVLKPQYKNIIK